jgi:hypothetical protein
MAVLYECGICGSYHPWKFTGDCRDDANRYGAPEDYAQRHHIAIARVTVRSMDERVTADEEES